MLSILRSDRQRNKERERETERFLNSSSRLGSRKGPSFFDVRFSLSLSRGGLQSDSHEKFGEKPHRSWRAHEPHMLICLVCSHHDARASGEHRADAPNKKARKSSHSPKKSHEHSDDDEDSGSDDDEHKI